MFLKLLNPHFSLTTSTISTYDVSLEQDIFFSAKPTFSSPSKASLEHLSEIFGSCELEISRNPSSHTRSNSLKNKKKITTTYPKKIFLLNQKNSTTEHRFPVCVCDPKSQGQDCEPGIGRNPWRRDTLKEIEEEDEDEDRSPEPKNSTSDFDFKHQFVTQKKKTLKRFSRRF